MPPRDPAPLDRRSRRAALRAKHAANQSGARRAHLRQLERERNSGEGEDCLVLNVWTPALNDGRKRPVLFWCHGGGFVERIRLVAGLPTEPIWRSAATWWWSRINHRLNALGFTYLAEFGGSEFASSGDVGMLDIVHALGWVRNNIEQFGGDPNTVMIFGQSGGGRKVGTLLAMPSAKGLVPPRGDRERPDHQTGGARAGDSRGGDAARQTERQQSAGARVCRRCPWSASWARISPW